MAYRYLHHRDFIAHRMNYHACPQGRDLPPDRRECGICLCRIQDDSRVARICPSAPELHTYHWLCMIEWLSTRVGEGGGHFARSCPVCRTQLFELLSHSDMLHTPTPLVRAYRETLARGWNELLAAAADLYGGPSMRYVDAPAPTAINPSRPLECLLGGCNPCFVLTLALLANAPQVEIIRSGAYLTDDRVELDSMIHFLNSQRSALGFSRIDYPDVEDDDDQSDSDTSDSDTPELAESQS